MKLRRHRSGEHEIANGGRDVGRPEKGGGGGGTSYTNIIPKQEKIYK